MNSTKLRKVTEARHATDSATDAMLNALRSGGIGVGGVQVTSYK